MLSAFYHWVWCELWICHLWPLLCWGRFPLYPLSENFIFNHKWIKCLEINLPKEAKDLYSENYEDDINRCKDILCSWIGKINIVKIIILPKAVYRFKQSLSNHQGFPDGTVVKNLPTNAGDTRDVSLIPGLGRSPRLGNGNHLQYSCLQNSMDRGAWRATSHGVAKSQDTMGGWAQIKLQVALFTELEQKIFKLVFLWKHKRPQ